MKPFLGRDRGPMILSNSFGFGSLNLLMVLRHKEKKLRQKRIQLWLSNTGRRKPRSMREEKRAEWGGCFLQEVRVRETWKGEGASLAVETVGLCFSLLKKIRVFL